MVDIAELWAHSNPIFMDWETQSACDIFEYGGRVYSEHPSTRPLILSMCVDDIFHVWIPDYIKVDTSFWKPESLWPYQMKPVHKVTLTRGKWNAFADVIGFDSIKSRPFVAHNAYGFDRFIWDRFVPEKVNWLDTMLLAKASGRSGSLDKLGKQLLGQGKDHAKKLLKILTTATRGRISNWAYPIIKNGDLHAFTRYAVADVEILRRLWKEFEDVQVESDVIEIHDIINGRGVHTDVPLLTVVERLTEYSTTTAVEEIEELTHGRLHKNNLRSTVQVHEWLDSFGIQIVDDKGKPCLRKEVVQRYIDSPYLIEENLVSATEIPPIVIKVLELRLKALRITEAKVKRAKARVCSDGRMRDLFSYHNAHTGRWSSHGVNIHNLPRPMKGIPELVEQMLTEWKGIPFNQPLDYEEQDIRKVFDWIKWQLKNRGLKTLTVDDVCSALMRPSFMAKPGHLLAIADYSQVESKGLAWIADEQKMLSVFADGRDIYREFAAIMFGVPLDQVNDYQRQVAKSAVLGCGYGLGADKFRVYAANMGADLTKAGVTAEFCIDKYRDTYTQIAGFKPQRDKNFRTNGIWHKLDNAVMNTVGTREMSEAGKCRYLMDGKNLLCILPSCRILTYPNARIEDVIPPYCYTMGLPLVPKACVVYDSPRGPKSLYGGLITENVVQAICRDLLAAAMLQLENEGYRTVLHIHDEICIETLIQDAMSTLRRMVEVMSNPPSWADGFPCTCEGYVNPRFTKKAFAGFGKLETHDLKKGMYK